MIIKDCGTVFTQIREHLGKTKSELADELGLGKHGERLIERIEQNKEDIQPATLRKLLDLLSGDKAGEIWQQFLEQNKEDCSTEELKAFEAKHKKRLKILYAIFIASVALTIVNTVVFFT